MISASEARKLTDNVIAANDNFLLDIIEKDIRKAAESGNSTIEWAKSELKDRVIEKLKEAGFRTSPGNHEDTLFIYW